MIHFLIADRSTNEDVLSSYINIPVECSFVSIYGYNTPSRLSVHLFLGNRGVTSFGVVPTKEKWKAIFLFLSRCRKAEKTND